MTPKDTVSREEVKSHYREHALSGSTCCPDGSCCVSAHTGVGAGLVGPVLGCGSPLDRAELSPGMDVLDLGCGAGREVIEAAFCIAPGGTAYGVDMTDEMLAIALENKRRAGANNAVFLRGTIENIPLPNASVDVIISNCVINLSSDKPAVMAEMWRVLRPGGRLAISDTVADRPVPDSAEANPDLWCACLSGAPQPEEYKRLLEEAGFVNVSIDVEGWDDGDVSGRGFRVGSAFISGRKPARETGDAPLGGRRPGRPEPALSRDLDAVLRLLKESGLPEDGVEANLRNFFVVRDGAGDVVGVAGAEYYGRQALLRSVVVRPDHRGRGIGARLVAAVIRDAAARRCREMYLLTTTADKYFERLGFRRIDRHTVSGPVSRSVEFQSACPETAVVMRRVLGCC